MKTLNFSQKVSSRNKFMFRLLLSMFFLLLSVTGIKAQQIIGTFSYMNGGFEGQTVGVLGTTVSATLWSRNSVTGSTSSIVTTSPRTGVNYATVTNAAAVTRGLQSPQLTPFVAASAPTANTAYMVQFYVRNAAAIPAFQVGTNTNGTSNTNYSTAATLAINTIWTKQAIATTTSANTVTSSGIAIIGRNTGGGTFDIDDVVIYAGTTADIIAPDAPTLPTIPTAAATQQTISWTAPSSVDGGGYMVVRSTADPTTTPNANGIYAVGNFVAGTEKVVYLGTNTSFVDLGLTQTTHYFYRIYTVDKAFNYSNAISVDGSTTEPSYAAEPNVQATGISFANVTSTSFDINWTVGNGTNSLVVVRATSAIDADPTDGGTYAPSTTYGSGIQVGIGNYVVYNGTSNSVTITGLTKLTNYYISVYSFNGSSGSENYLLTNAASANKMTSPGEIVSSGANSAGSSWAATATWAGNVVPGASDNVTIAAGDKILVASSQSCYNLTIPATAKVYNNTPLPTTSVSYLTVYGTSLLCNGTLGDKITDGSADGALGINFVGNLTISGSGLMRPSRIRANAGTQNATLIIDANMEMAYNGGTGTGGAGMYPDNASSNNDNITITVNSERTLSFVSNSNFNTTSSTGTNATGNVTFNINGTVNMNPNSAFSLLVGPGKSCTLNVNGTLNVGNFNATSAAGGSVPTIKVGANGVIAVSDKADFSSTSLSGVVTGAGTFTLNSGGTITIANATGLEPVAGPIRTTTRYFNSAANYSYLGTTAQVTGSELPATVNNLTINNTTGVTLSNAATVNGALTLTAGTLSLGTNNLTLGAIGSISGASATSFIVTDDAGKLVQSVAASTAKLFPIGSSTTSYDPVTLTPTDATDFSAKVYSTLPAVAPSNYFYNQKVWDLIPVTPSSTVVSLTPSAETVTGTNAVIGHYVVDQYENKAATYATGNYAATFSSFSPFVTGKTDLPTVLNKLDNNGTKAYSSNNQLIVTNLKVGDLVSIYALNGLQLKSYIANSSQYSANLPLGVYLIKVKSSSDLNVFKVILK